MKFEWINNILSNLDSIIDDIKYPVFIVLITILHIFYIIIFFGIFFIDPVYLRWLSTFIQFMIALFLIFRFHPFRTHELRKNDDKLIFACGSLLLINTSFTEYIIAFVNSSFSKNIIKQ